MTALLLSVHVLAGILVVGPIAVAASLFPRVAAGGPVGRGPAQLLHRICRVYAVIGVVVPVFGIATGAQLGVLTDPWLLVSMALTVVAAGVLGALILPAQRRMLDGTDTDRTVVGPGLARRLTAATGAFNLLWAVVVVLMIVRPGSTTGV